MRQLIQDGTRVDCIVTDPAYKVISGGNKSDNRPSGILKKNDGKIFTQNSIKIAEWMPLCFDILKDPAHAYIMTNFINLQEMMNVGVQVGFKFHNLLIWEKNNVTPNRWYMKNVEYTLFARKGKAFSINNKGAKTCIKVNNVKNRDHPTQKPLELMKEYISNSTQEGDTVLDPFMGAGTTGVACKELNRKFIGIELDPVYYEISKNKLT